MEDVIVGIDFRVSLSIVEVALMYGAEHYSVINLELWVDDEVRPSSTSIGIAAASIVSHVIAVYRIEYLIEHAVRKTCLSESRSRVRSRPWIRKRAC